MIIVQGGRQDGKTAHLVQWFMVSPATRGVLCPTAEARNQFIRAVELACPDGMPPGGERLWRRNIATPETVRTSILGTGIREFAIDDLDLILLGLCGGIHATLATTTDLMTIDTGGRLIGDWIRRSEWGRPQPE